MRKVVLLTSLVGIGLVACSREQAPAAKDLPAGSASASIAKHVVDPSASTSGSASTKPAEKPSPEVHKAYAFDGVVGKDTKVRVYLDVAGKKVNGVYVDDSGGDHALVGVVDGDQVKLAEHEGKATTATIEGGLYDGLFKGTWKDAHTGKSQIVVTSVLTLGTSKFSQSYVGALGSKLRIRAKLDDDGGKIHGVYRYTRSTSDLVLDGTVDAKGAFVLTESSGGTPTGKLEGYFLGQRFAVGTWSSVDGSRSLPMTLHAAGAYPEIVTLPSGGKIAPQETYDARSKTCTSTLISPQFDGLASADAQKKLNAAVKKAVSAAPLSKDDCDGSSAELLYEFETNYSAVTSTKPYAGLELSSYAFTGGAHGNYGASCYVADLTNGTLVSLGDQLTKEGRAKLTPLVNARLLTWAGTETLADACFFDEKVELGDHPNVCLAADGGVDIFFNPYEVACYAAGQPSAHLTLAEVAGTFAAGSVGDALFK